MVEINVSVDGGWSRFDEWSECTAICGEGTQTRTRTCNNPSPDHGGAPCQGQSTDTQYCNTFECPGKMMHQQVIVYATLQIDGH